jgi:energy-coupling factor transporter ATP-binding protein EcfA2
MTVIAARGLRKAFGTTIALDGVDLRVGLGRTLPLIGPNRAGKSTALNAIPGLTRYQRERKVVGRDPWTERDQLMRDVSFIADVAVLPRRMPTGKATYDTRKSIAATLSATIASSGIDEAAKQYHDLTAAGPAPYNFDEDELNTLGYQLIRANKFKEAIRILKLNVEACPQSGNVYDTLGEAYMGACNQAAGHRQLSKIPPAQPKEPWCCPDAGETQRPPDLCHGGHIVDRSNSHERLFQSSHEEKRV